MKEFEQFNHLEKCISTKNVRIRNIQTVLTLSLGYDNIEFWWYNIIKKNYKKLGKRATTLFDEVDNLIEEMDVELEKLREEYYEQHSKH